MTPAILTLTPATQQCQAQVATLALLAGTQRERCTRTGGRDFLAAENRNGKS